MYKYIESVCQVARGWVDGGSIHTRLVVGFMIFTPSVRNILDTPAYSNFLHSHLILNNSTRSIILTINTGLLVKQHSTHVILRSEV
jgi:hypothetical protein